MTARRTVNPDVWSGLGDCFTCGADPGKPCTGIGDKYSAMYPPVIKRPHRSRTLASRIAHAETAEGHGQIGLMLAPLAKETP